MFKNRRLIGLLVLALIMVLALAACGGDDEDDEEPEATPIATVEPTEEATEAPTEEATEVATEAPTEEATEEAVTEEPTEAATEEATEEAAATEAATEEAAAVAMATEEATEEAAATEEATEEAAATEEVTEEAATEEIATEEATPEAVAEATAEVEAIEAPALIDCEQYDLSEMRIGLVTDVGQINDKSFNQSSWQGVLSASLCGAEVDYIETVDAADYADNIAEFAENDFNVIVTVGFALGPATLEAAATYPDVTFIGVDQFQVEPVENVAGLVFHEDQSGFLAGVLAARLTETGTIAAVLGTDQVPPVVAFNEGYLAGARYVNPDINIISTYHPGGIDQAFTDPEWGATTARQALDQNADVIFGAGGKTGNGALIEVANAVGDDGPPPYCIGVDTDQWETVPEAHACLVSSAMKLLDKGVADILMSIADGNFTPGNFFGAAALAPFHDLEDKVPAEVADELAQVAAALQDGSLSTGYGMAPAEEEAATEEAATEEAATEEAATEEAAAEATEEAAAVAMATEETTEEAATEEVATEVATEEAAAEATEEATEVAVTEATEEPTSEAEATAEVEVIEAPALIDCEQYDLSEMRIGLVTDVGQINDKSFNQSSWQGVLSASLCGAEVDYIETVDAADYADNIAEFAENDFNVIVTVGFALGPATLEAAATYPDVTFIGVDQFQVEPVENVAGLVFHEDQSGFLAGVLAARLTETGTIAAVLGTDQVPPVVAFNEGYLAGARYVNPDINIISTYHPGGIDQAFTDPEWGATTARQALDQNADVIFGAGGKTGNGALIEVANAVGDDGPPPYCIGVDTDQWETVPEAHACLVSSAMKLLDKGVADILMSIADGNFTPGNFFGAAALAPFHDHEASIPEDVIQELVEVAQGLGDGTISTGYGAGAAPEETEVAAEGELGVVTVGMNAEYPPFEFVDENNEIAGFDVDLMNAIAEEAGFDVEFVNTRWDGIFVALQSGEFDAVASAATITDEREEIVDFSEPYFNAGQMIAVLEDRAGEISTPDDLAGLRVGVQSGTTGDIWASENIPGVEMVRYDEITLAFQALASGDVDAVFNDGPVSADIITKNPEMGAVLVGDPVTNEFYGIAVNPERPELLDAINEALAAIIANGTYREIYMEWFGVEPPSMFQPAG
jgi:basic membrane protein A